MLTRNVIVESEIEFFWSSICVLQRGLQSSPACVCVCARAHAHVWVTLLDAEMCLALQLILDGSECPLNVILFFSPALKPQLQRRGPQ